MHAVKGGWVGQTFALASYNDSGGKKSRIRRSKEERKSMVESFVKKYQKLNNGNFPSLNLTHKEVGGSFYTVREIVREIIQENKVLGPAKLPLREDSNNDILQHFPLGSLSIEPPTATSFGELDILSQVQLRQNNGEQVLAPNELQGLELGSGKEDHHFEDVRGNESCMTEVTSNLHQGATSEPLSNSCEKFYQPELPKLECVDTGSDSVITEEVGKSYEQVLVSPFSDHNEEINQESHQKTNAQVFVHPGGEPFMNEHVKSDIEQGLDKHSRAGEENSDFRESSQVNMIVEENLVAKEEQRNKPDGTSSANCMKHEVVVETFPLRPVTQTINGLEGRPDKQFDGHTILEEKGNERETVNILEDISSLMDVDVATSLACSTSEKMDDKAFLSSGYLSSESSNYLTAKETLVDGHNSVAETEVSSVAKLVNSPEDMNHGSVGDLDNKILQEQIITEIAAASESEPNIVDNISSLNKTASTLDRTILQKWEGTSKKSSGTEDDSLLALLKAFIAALVKFFTQ